MSTTNAELRALAEKATPGPWHWHEGDLVDEEHQAVVAFVYDDQDSDLDALAPDAAYIAAAHPARILELLSEHGRFQLQIKSLEETLDLRIDELDKQDTKLTVLRAKLDLAMRTLKEFDKLGISDYARETLAQLKEQP